MASFSSSRILRIGSFAYSRISEQRSSSTLYQYCLRPSCLALSELRNERRAFTFSHVSRAALASHPIAQPTVLLAYPTVPPENEDEDDIDIEFVPPDEAQIRITDRAAEVR